MKIRGAAGLRLTFDELEACRDFTARVQADKRAHGVVDRKFDKNNTSEGVNLMGIAGEILAARFFGWDPDCALHTFGDGGRDAIHRGLAFQVKTSTTSRLIFNSADKFSTDIAVAVQMFGDRNEVTLDTRFSILGLISRQRFFEVCQTMNFGYGDRLVCSYKDLGGLEVIEQFGSVL